MLASTPGRARRLSAGPLDLLFEHGQILYLRFSGVEVVRRVYVAVRDARWVAVPVRILDEEVRERAGGFVARCRAVCEEGDVCLKWNVTIEAEADGSGANLVFAFSGKAETAFASNRLGLCILHDTAGFAGRPAEFETLDGASGAADFPVLAHPDTPFSNLAALRYYKDNLKVELRFSGDAFETEDQRQWGDASFKTYSRLCSLPIPFAVAAGERFEQTLVVRIEGQAPVATPKFEVAPSALSVTIDSRRSYTLPPIGFALPNGLQAHTGRERTRLLALNPNHFRVDLVPVRASSAEVMAVAVEESKRFGVPLELGLWLSRAGQKDITRLIETLDTYTPKLVGVVLLPLAGHLLSADGYTGARRALGHSIPEVPIGIGTAPYFADLNRARGLCEKAKFISLATQPFAHLCDGRTLVENLSVPRLLAETVWSFAPGVPLVLGRVDLRPQPSPGTGAYVEVARPGQSVGDLAAHVEPLQASLLCAGWVAAQLGDLARVGFQRVTYFETTGPLGVLPSERQPALPVAFAPPGTAVFPMYHVFADLGAFPSREVLELRASDPLAVGGVALRSGRRVRILLANLSDEVRTVTLAGAKLRSGAMCRYLDAEHLAWATREPESFRAAPGQRIDDASNPFTLSPHAILRIDGELDA